MTDLTPELAAIRSSLSPELAAVFDRQLGVASPETIQVGSEPVESIIKESDDGRIRYPESASAYGLRYGVSGRTVRSWIELGKDLEPRDLPPLHHPPSLAEWYRAYRNNRVPDGIADLAATYKAAEAVERAGEPVDTASRQKKSFSGSVKDASGGGEVFSESVTFDSGGDIADDVFVNQLKTVAQGAYEQYLIELDKGRRTQAKAWQKDWMDAVSKLRQWVKELMLIEQEKGVLVRKSTILAELVSLGGAAARNAEKGYGEVITDLLSRLPAVDREKIDPALVEVRKSHPDLVPLLDGVETLLKLRANPADQRQMAVKHRDAAFDKLRMMEFGDAFVDGADAA